MTRPIIDLGWRLDTIAQRLGGSVVGDDSATITSVTIDSRDVPRGSLFVAIVGENFDGHDFASTALESGAAAVVVERGSGVDAVPRVEVPATLDALKQLSVERRNELGMPVVAITGSTGKTSTKDLIAAGIPGSWSSPRSFNNEIGVPLTVLSTPDDAAALIVEVGSRGVGHIAWLAPVVRPDVAVVTNLGVVHLETFGSEPALADAKHELIESLGGNGTAVIPSNEPRLMRDTGDRVITFGRAPADVAVTGSGVGIDGSTEFSIQAGDSDFHGTLSMAGAHQAFNAAASVGVCVALGFDIEPFIEGMKTTTGSEWRMDVQVGKYTVINDAYNANPQSIAAAFESVAAMPGRSFAVVGPMAELGPVCEQQHRLMGELASTLQFENLIVVGPDHGYALGAPHIVVHATDIDSARDTLTAILEPGDIVLVKASRSSGLERLALQLSKESTQ